jgi:hypothetical protein
MTVRPRRSDGILIPKEDLRDIYKRIRYLEGIKIPEVDPGVTFDPFYEAVASLAATRDLLGYWRLGDGASPFADTSGHASGPNNMVKTATGTAMTDSVTGALPAADDDGAVQFNAVSGVSGDHLIASHATLFRGSTDSTAALWIKPAGSYTGSQYIFGTQDLSNGGWHVGMSGATRPILFRRRDGGGNVAAAGPSLPNEWVFVSVDWNPTGGVNIYLNGALVYADGISQGVFDQTDLYLGRRAGGTPDSFQGAVDEVSFWGTRLTAAEHAYLAAAGGLAQDEGVRNVVAVSGAYTATAGDVVLATGTITVTLPTAVGISGESITVKNAGVGTITVARTSSQTIDGAASNKTISTTKAALEFTSDGSGWQITAAYL